MIRFDAGFEDSEILYKIVNLIDLIDENIPRPEEDDLTITYRDKR